MKNKQTKNVKKGEKSTFGLMPLGDRVILQEIKDEEKSSPSGIYIPDSVNDDKGAKEGVVVAVGDGRLEDGVFIPMKLKVGDKVLYQWGEKIIYKEEEYTIVREQEVVALVK